MKRVHVLIAIVVIALALLAVYVLPGDTIAALLPTTKGEGVARYFVYFKEIPSDEEIFEIEKHGPIKYEYRDMPRIVSMEISAAAAAAISKKPNVKKVEKVGILQIAVRGKPSPKPQPTQTIPWGISHIKADAAWAQSTGSGVQVAVLDTGVDLRHPDLFGNIAWQKSELGFKSAADRNGHGTHVSGTVLAINNDIGVVGVAHTAKLYALQVCDAAGYCYVDAITKGIEDAMYGPDGVLATDDDAEVISMSFGGSSPLGEAFETQMRAAYAKGIALVAAAGNDGATVKYPAAYDEVIAVGAVDKNNAVPDWSGRGAQLELVAPGVDILSTWKGSSYATASGTSMATPHVSGTVALMVAKNTSLTPDQIRSILRTTAVDLGTAGRDDITGYGLVDALAAVSAS